MTPLNHVAWYGLETKFTCDQEQFRELMTGLGYKTAKVPGVANQGNLFRRACSAFSHDFPGGMRLEFDSNSSNAVDTITKFLIRVDGKSKTDIGMVTWSKTENKISRWSHVVNDSHKEIAEQFIENYMTKNAAKLDGMAVRNFVNETIETNFFGFPAKQTGGSIYFVPAIFGGELKKLSDALYKIGIDLEHIETTDISLAEKYALKRCQLLRNVVSEKIDLVDDKTSGKTIIKIQKELDFLESFGETCTQSNIDIESDADILRDVLETKVKILNEDEDDDRNY